MKRQTQYERLYGALRRRWMTYGDMLAIGASTSPWKRIKEGTHYLRPFEQIERRVGPAGLVQYRVSKAP